MAICLLFIVIFLVLYRLNQEYFFDYDSFYNLEISTSLAASGKYATSPHNFFDVQITTGPTLLVPVAIAFGLFGQNLNSIYLVLASINSLFITSIILIPLLLHRSSRAIFIYPLISVFFILYFIKTVYAFEVVGETLGVLFLLWGFFFAFRAGEIRNKVFYLISGILLGLSVVTKLLDIILIVPVVYLPFYFHHKKILGYLKYLVFGLLLPILIWNFYIFATLGGFDQYIEYLKGWYQFVTEYSTYYLAPDGDRIKSDSLSGYFGTLLLTILFIISSVVSIKRHLKPRYFVLLKVFLISVLFGIFYFLVMDRTAMDRHLYPATLLLASTLAVFTVLLIHSHKRGDSKVFFPLLFLALTLCSLLWRGNRPLSERFIWSNDQRGAYCEFRQKINKLQKTGLSIDPQDSKKYLQPFSDFCDDGLTLSPSSQNKFYRVKENYELDGLDRETYVDTECVEKTQSVYRIGYTNIIACEAK